MATSTLALLSRSCKISLQQRGWNLLQSLNRSPIVLKKSLHTSSPSLDLLEFFDDKKNWAEKIVRVGRSWKKEELRTKSNSDLHKLWFVLLKERNMLMSMEHECNEEFEHFPNPERLDKVKESMHNLEEVVIERNRAYHELETGETGMRPGKEVINQIGVPFFYKMREHLIPKLLNSTYRQNNKFRDNYSETKLFHALLAEKEDRMKRRSIRGQTKHVMSLLRRFPDLDLEAVKEKFPDVEVDKLSKSDKARGHWLP